MKNIILTLFSFLITFSVIAQENTQDIDYRIIATGPDSPFNSLKIVCFNKYFNLERTKTSFRQKYGLDDKSLYKKKMLAQIFCGLNDVGYDKILVNSISESATTIFIDYAFVNESKDNDNEDIRPFTIIQLAKSKKQIVFVENGVIHETGSKIYINN